jgi:oxaloacetate decarboxylase beta subunit
LQALSLIAHIIAMLAGGALIYLAIKKKYEQYLLLPIGFGIILTNIPGSVMLAEGEGLFHILRKYLISTEILPLFIFLSIGAMTDFGPLLASPKNMLLGAGAQFGVYITLLVALVIGFNVPEACSIGIIGGADGPTTLYISTKISQAGLATFDIVPVVALSAYAYMALVPIIQPPIMRALTTPKERKIEMPQVREVSKTEKILFPLVTTIAVAVVLPSAAPIIGMIMVGNLLRESGVVNRLAETASRQLMDVLTIVLGLTIGGMFSAEVFLEEPLAIAIFVLGILAFAVATASGLVLGKIMNKVSGGKINPLIGAAGVSAVPMAARIAHKIGQKENPRNFLLMHAMGPNVAGVIGTAIAAGVFMTFVL